MCPTGFELFKKLYLHSFLSLTSSSLSESLNNTHQQGLELNLEWKLLTKSSISASLTKAIFISIRAASSQQYARVPHAMAQLVLKIAQVISWGLSRPSKCYFVTVSVPDYGFCFVSTLTVRSFSVILFRDFPSDSNYHLNKAEHFRKSKVNLSTLT